MIKMPWCEATAPNAMLEITNACNLQCRACYREHGTSFKSIEEVRRDLNTGIALRPLHTITISGGEPTLHPDLCRIVALVKAQRVHVFLLTNGVLLDAAYMRRLKESGLDSVLFHVDEGQQRPDLPEGSGFAPIEHRLSELTHLATASGLDVSVSATLYENSAGFLHELSRFVLHHPDISFLFISRAIMSGVQPARAPPHGLFPGSTAQAILSFYADTYDLAPFAYIPATPGGRISWLSYFIPIVYRDGLSPHIFRFESNRLDAWLMRLPKLLTGRFIHKTTQQPSLTFFRTAINAISTLRIRALGRLLAAATAPGARLRHKVIAYDVGPVQTGPDTVERCEYCPTPIIRNGLLVPCCVSNEHGAGQGVPA